MLQYSGSQFLDANSTKCESDYSKADEETENTLKNDMRKSFSLFIATSMCFSLERDRHS